MKILFKSLYPSIILEFNIAPNTQIGRIVIPEKAYEFENAYKIPDHQYSRGGEFIENMVTDNIIEFCKRWFNLGGIEDVLNDIGEYNDYKSGSNFVKAGFKEVPISITRIEKPIEFTGSKVESPIIFCGKVPDDLSYDKIIADRRN